MSLAEAKQPVFEAFMTPHRSLSKRGVTAIFSVITLFTGLFCLRFWLIGAWPVMLFSVVDVPILAALLALNFRRARQSECLMLNDATLTITRTDAQGRHHRTSLSTAWLRVSLKEDSGASRILLSTRGRDYEVGAFLHESDRLALFDTLRDALHAVRNPTFDNPQLRST